MVILAKNPEPAEKPGTDKPDFEIIAERNGRAIIKIRRFFMYFVLGGACQTGPATEGKFIISKARLEILKKRFYYINNN